MTPDTKILNAATFRVEKEDHTLGNLLRMRLLEDNDVLFAGYKVPHPLDHAFLLKVQTTPQSTPTRAVSEAIQSCIADLSELENNFKAQLTQFNESYM